MEYTLINQSALLCIFTFYSFHYHFLQYGVSVIEDDTIIRGDDQSPLIGLTHVRIYDLPGDVIK